MSGLLCEQTVAETNQKAAASHQSDRPPKHSALPRYDLFDGPRIAKIFPDYFPVSPGSEPAPPAAPAPPAPTEWCPM
jgi:hypothetical protein